MTTYTRHIRQLVTTFILFIGSLMFLTTTTQAEGTFTVGMEAGYPPFNWTQYDDSNGAVPIKNSRDFAGGYDVEIAKRMADDLGKELVIFKTEWDGLAPALTSGKVDAIIAGMSPTAERKKTIDFSDVYYNSDLVLLVKSDGAYAQATSLEDFKEAKVTAQLSTLHYTVIDQIEGVNKQTAMDNFPAMRVALESGKIDAYVTERPEGIVAEKINPKFKMIAFDEGKGFETSEDDTAIAVGLRKNDPNKEAINQLLGTISKDERNDIMDNVLAIQLETNIADDSEEKAAVETTDETAEKQELWVVKIIRENGSAFLRGAGVTLLISLVGTVVGTAIGLGIGIFRTIPTPKKPFPKMLVKFLNGFFSVYIEIFRGTPMIVQAMVIYYGSAQAFGIDVNPLVAGLFIVSINTGAYMTEIVRGGIFAVDKGQFEAAAAIGMTHAQTMWNVVIPQVFRNTLPAIGNEFVINIKDTSVLNVIAVSELFFQAKTVAGGNLRFFDTFFVACVLYFIMTFTVTRILRSVEKRLDGNRHYAPYANQMQTSKLERKDD